MSPKVLPAQPLYGYDQSGDVVDWGSSNVNQYLTSVPGSGVQHVQAWKTWMVKVWWNRSGHPWYLSSTFYVQNLEEIQQHWASYFDCGIGHTERITFEAECWFWSFEGGWEYQDYM